MLLNKKWPLALLVLVLGFAAPSRSSAPSNDPIHPRHAPAKPRHAPTKYEKILHDVSEMLEEIHYSPRPIDDSFSREVFKKYLNGINPEKKILMESDIDSLSRFRNTINNEILGKAPVQFAQAVNGIYLKRLDELEAIMKEILSRPFDFTQDEYVDLNDDRLDFPEERCRTPRRSSQKAQIPYA